MDYLAGLFMLILGLLLSQLDWLQERETKILTILGWGIALIWAKGGVI